jgi:hypothetical protein
VEKERAVGEAGVLGSSAIPESEFYEATKPRPISALIARSYMHPPESSVYSEVIETIHPES